MIVGARKPAKLAGRPNLEFSNFARRRSKFAEFPFIIVLQPLFPVLISVPQIPPPAMCAHSHRPPCSIRQPQKVLDLRLQQLQQWPPMRSLRLWLLSFPADQTKPVDPYERAQAARCRAARLGHRRSSPFLWPSR